MAQCVRCGMDRGWNLLFCPTCELVQAQRDANDMQRQNQDLNRRQDGQKYLEF